jgi:hypothetical protein
MRMWSDLPYCYAGLATLMEGGNTSVACGGGGNRIRGGVGGNDGCCLDRECFADGARGVAGVEG